MFQAILESGLMRGVPARPSYDVELEARQILAAARKRDWRFYVYEILRGSAVIYVGKGQKNRAKVSAKNFGGTHVIIAHFYDEKSALDFEKSRIKERTAEGWKLENISHGNSIPWGKRTDTVLMAREILEWVAFKFDPWVKAGRVERLAKIIRMEPEEIITLHQRFVH